MSAASGSFKASKAISHDSTQGGPVLNNKVFSSPLLHYKSLTDVYADLGAGPVDTGVDEIGSVV